MYNLHFSTTTVTSGTIRECDPLRKPAQNIATVLKGKSSATIMLKAELFGLSIDYEPSVSETEKIDLSGGPDKDKIYEQLNRMSEILVDRILPIAKRDLRLMNALNGQKIFSMPNCAVS